MKFRFCPECGAELIGRAIGDEGEIPFCENCGRPWFSFSYPCVICLLTDGEGKYALIRQTYATKNYVCVAGFIREQETAEQTAIREVREETGLEVQDIRLPGQLVLPEARQPDDRIRVPGGARRVPPERERGAVRRVV